MADAGRLVFAGDLMTDITAVVAEPVAYGSDARAAITLQPGGAAANSARWAAFLGYRSLLIASAGDDPAADGLLQQLGDEGVSLAVSRVPGTRTGACIVLVDPSGERTMFPDAGANALLAAAQVAWSPADSLHVSGYALFHDVSREAAMAMIADARAAGAQVSLDPASAAPLHAHAPAVRAALHGVQIVLANAPEARVLTGESDPERAALVLAESVPLAVVKRGADGVTAAWGSEALTLPAPATRLVDSTGAGDAFAAGFLGTLQSGTALHEALSAGQDAAAAAIGRVGAGPPPTGAGRMDGHPTD